MTSDELLDINARFVQAKRGYESMLEESWAQHSSTQQSPFKVYPNFGLDTIADLALLHSGYGLPVEGAYYNQAGQQPPQPIPYAGQPTSQSAFYPAYQQPIAEMPQVVAQQQALPMPGQSDSYQQQQQQMPYQQPTAPEPVMSPPQEQQHAQYQQPTAYAPFPSGYPGSTPPPMAPQSQQPIA